MGEIDPSDIYHHFKPYREDMRAWIHDISEGESAFDNEDINKRPYKIVDGEIVVHNNMVINIQDNVGIKLVLVCILIWLI